MASRYTVLAIVPIIKEPERRSNSLATMNENPAKPLISARQLEQALQAAGRAPGSLFSITFSIPPVQRESVCHGLWKWDSSLCANLWSAPEELPEATLGAVVRLVAGGAGRFRSIEKQASALWDGLICLGWQAEPLAPRLWGGAAFRADFSSLGDWSDFSPAEFVLPRWRFTGENIFTLYVRDEELRSSELRARLIGQTSDLLWFIQKEEARQQQPSPSGSDFADTSHDIFASCQLVESVPEKKEWGQLLRQARIAFDNGTLEKVVLARKIILQPKTPIDWAVVWNRLENRAKSETRYAFRREASVFLGASPERLVARKGPLAMADALAGSRPTSPTSERNFEQLLTSEKNLREHQYVVREIAARLAHLGGSVEPLPLPAIRELRHILHLHTPISSTFTNSPHILRLVENLHPTPAVGGTPTEKAMEFLAQHGPFERGWYAGPVGWFSENGDGDFAVALRSGLFREGRVQLFSGAGLVSGSETHSEWEETEWKLRAMWEAIS